MSIFRVHLSNGEKRDLTAVNPEEARKAAVKGLRDVNVTKIKVLKQK